MKSKILLRIAALLVLIHLLGHSLGHLGWDKPEDPKMKEVVNVMQGYKGEFMGASKSMADYFNGYSLILFFVFGMTIAILWVCSGFIENHRAIAIKVLFPIAFAYIGFGVIEYMYFFPFAASISLLTGIVSLLAITVVKK
jgi:hypothetical protein